MPVYDPTPIMSGSILDPDAINLQTSTVASAYTRGRGYHEMPLTGVGIAPLEQRTYQSTDFDISRGVFSDVYSFSRFQTTSSVETSVSLRTGSINAGGWTTIASIGAVADPRTLDAVPTSVLLGHSFISFSRRYGYVSPGLTVSQGDGNWTTFGVFVDGTLVKQTDKIYPRVTTVVIPWVLPTQGGDMTVELKFKASYTELNSSNTRVLQDVNIFGHGHMVEAIKR
jgi:hypothetical protein